MATSDFGMPGSNLESHYQHESMLLAKAHNTNPVNTKLNF